MKLLDTSVAVDHLRGRQEATSLLERLVGEGVELAASEVIRFELLAGVRERELESLERFFAALSWAPVDEGVSRIAGELARRHKKSHSGIGDVDYLIAATSILLDAELITTNVRHFPMLRGLQSPY